MATNSRPMRIPAFVRMRAPGWGVGGTSYGAYLAALVDRDDLASARVLGIDANADMLLGIVNADWRVGSYTAVEPDLVTAAYFSGHLDDHDVELIVSDLDDQREETIAAMTQRAPFDVVVVRSAPAAMTADRLDMLLETLRPITAPDAKVIVTVALALTTVAGRGAGDRLADRGILDEVDGYLEYEWELGMIPVYSPQRVEEIAAARGWRVDQVCEPRRSFQQHHVVLAAAL